MKSTLLASALTFAFASSGWALDYRSSMQGFVDSTLSLWAEAPVLIDAIQAQNVDTAGYDAARITELDQTWRAEVGTASAPLVDSIVGNAASDFLRMRAADSGGMVTEVFVMDAQGLNVASSGYTSDYWQGDEAKFTETYGKGAGAVHFGEVEFDESSQTYQAQISMTIVDPDTGAPIGAVTVGVDAEAFM